MRLEQLMYLVAVNESKSISLAAERSHISQPALSSAISKLEDELGVVLLKRTNSGAYLTDVGELIIVKAKEVLSGIDDIKAIAHGNSLVLNGNISIAADPGVNITIMPDILTTFKYNHPKVNVLLKVGESNNILQDIEKGKADFGIILSTDAFRKSKDMQSIELFADEFVVITGSNRKLASESTITLKRAFPCPFFCTTPSTLPNVVYQVCCKNTALSTSRIGSII